MRFRLTNLPFFLLLLLPITVSLLNLSPITTTLLLIIWCPLRLFIDILARAGRSDKLVLETLSASQYAEKVRWCLDHLDIPYVEEPDAAVWAGIVFGRTLPRLRMDGSGIVVSNSSIILRFLHSLYCKEVEKSSFLAVSAENLQLESRLDDYAHLFRAFAYYTLFEDGRRGNNVVLRRWGSDDEKVPIWQKVILVLTYPILRQVIRMRFGITDAQVAFARLKEANSIIEKEIEQILSDGRLFINGGEEPEYIDFVFAALAGMHAYPDNLYGKRSENSANFVPLEERSEIYQREVRRFRATRAGQLVLRMHKHYR